MALHFGSLSLAFPVIQAALSGYSDVPMRKISKSLGAEFTLCEVLLDQFVVSVSRGSKAKLYLQVDRNDHPCGAQLMGSEPETFVNAAKKVVDCGFDLVDLNFACPVRKVLGRARGGYMMSDPQTALQILERVRDAIPEHVPLTMKVRKGFDDSEESREKFFTLLHGALQRGIAGITLHGRTVLQRYTGECDWNFIAEVKSWLVESGFPNVPLLGSGDLFTAETCMRRMRESGVDGLALARGVIGNPWLFRDVRALMQGETLPPPPSLAEQKAVMREHFRLSEELYGYARASRTMRSFGIRYAKLHPNEQLVRDAFVREPWNDVLEKWY